MEVEAVHPMTGGKALYFGGHCFYVRKCVTGTQEGDNFWDRKVGNIFIPQTASEYSLFVEVIAKGARVGMRCTINHRKKFVRPYHFADVIEVGDLLLCPNDSIGIQRTPLEDAAGRRMRYEYFIEESIPLGIHKADAPHGLSPWGDRVLVRMLPEDDDGGVVLVDPELKAQIGEVMSVGPGILTKNGAVQEMGLDVGDKVLLKKRSGIGVGFDFGDQNMKIFRSTEVLGVLED